MYQYGWLDKVTQITEGDKVIRSFRYHMDGQLAAAYDGSNTETFLWDGLALIRRDTTNYLNEPAVTGGNPVIAGEKTLFNDLLGSTLGAKSADGFSAIERDAFGEVKPGETADLGINFFTGKPQVEGLGYTFLFRNYRPDQGKWQTADPLGYPDGWNNLAYVNNGVTMNIDWQGTVWVKVGDFSGSQSFSWPEPVETGYDTPSQAKEAMSSIVAAKQTEIYRSLQASYPSSPPHVVQMNSWDVDYVVRPHVNGDGKWYVAQFTINYTYSVYKEE